MAFNPCPSSAYIRLWRDVVDPNYADGMEAAEDAGGMDLVYANAAVWARVEQAVNTSQQACFLRPHSTATGPTAQGQTYATGTVTIARLAPADWELVIPQGTTFVASADGSRGGIVPIGEYISTEPVTMAIGALTATIPVRARIPGYVGNIDANQITSLAPLPTLEVGCTALSQSSLGENSGSSDVFGGGLIGRYVRVIGSADPRTPRRIYSETTNIIAVTPALEVADVGLTNLVAELETWEDFSCTVQSSTAMTGGVDGTLDAIGADRGMVRASGESDASYSARIASVADTVTPPAIQRIIDRTLEGTPAYGTLLETRDPDGLMGFVADFHPLDNGTPCESAENYGGQGTVLLDENSYRAHFIVCLSNIVYGEYGMFWSKPASPASLPSAFNLPAGVNSGAFNGASPGALHLVPGLWDAINAARAAGVSFDILKH